MFQIIAFDADDTLWENEAQYHNAKENFKQLLSKYQHSELIGQLLDEIEIRNIDVYGYGIKSFTLSMIETAIDLTDGTVKGLELQRIIEISKEMLQAEVEVFEDAEETLRILSENYDLMLITKGDQFEQERKIERSGLSGYFRYIEIVGEKSKKNYQAILDKYKIDPLRFLMVGNSLRSDIVPVIAIGGRAVYIHKDQTWFHEMVPIEEIDSARYDELEHLGQLPEYVDRVSTA